MRFDVLDRACLPQSPESLNADRLVVTGSVAAVVDGTTSKPWHGGSMDGRAVAEQVAQALCKLDGTEDAVEVVRRLSLAVAEAKRVRNCDVRAGGAATLAVVLGHRRQILRIGDPWVRVGSLLHSPRVRAEHGVAAARALLTARAIAHGTTVDELRQHDTAREEVLPLLRATDELRNHATSAWAFAAIDGGDVPTRLIECWSLPESDVEITLATDGYPVLGVDLAATERALRERLSRDPLLVEDPPATKGSPAENASFDDRSFLRLRVLEV